jgi:hypothetical protein
MRSGYAKYGDYAESEGSGWEGIRTPGALRHTRFPGVHNRPLCHPSFRDSCSHSWVLLVSAGSNEEHDDEHGPELQLQPSEQFIERQLNADKKFAEICILSTHSIETHLVDDFFDLESISGKERYAPFGIIESG